MKTVCKCGYVIDKWIGSEALTDYNGFQIKHIEFDPSKFPKCGRCIECIMYKVPDENDGFDYSYS